MSQTHRYLTREEAATYIGHSVDDIDDLIANGSLPLAQIPFDTSAGVLLDIKDLDDLIERSKVSRQDLPFTPREILSLIRDDEYLEGRLRDISIADARKTGISFTAAVRQHVATVTAGTNATIEARRDARRNVVMFPDRM